MSSRFGKRTERVTFFTTIGNKCWWPEHPCFRVTIKFMTLRDTYNSPRLKVCNNETLNTTDMCGQFFMIPSILSEYNIFPDLWITEDSYEIIKFYVEILVYWTSNIKFIKYLKHPLHLTMSHSKINLKTTETLIVSNIEKKLQNLNNFQ